VRDEVTKRLTAGAGVASGAMAHPIEVILLRELADHLAMPIFVVDAAGDLLFYNDPAEKLLGCHFDETGMMPFEEWSVLFTPTYEDNTPIAPDDLPLAIAAQQRRPALGGMWILGLDGARRQLTVTAIPLEGQWGQHLGAAAIFWEET
jgi:PAS domain-containing protein